MIILHKENENEGTFYIQGKEQPLAEMVYTKEKDKMVIQHTEVDELLRGKNIGFQLVEQGVEYARDANLKIVPLCKFAKKIIEGHKAFQNVL
jgi:predicted GNAT family acetyltransferase